MMMKSILITSEVLLGFFLYFSGPLKMGCRLESVYAQEDNAQINVKKMTAIQLIKGRVEGIRNRPIEVNILENRINQSLSNHKLKEKSIQILREWCEKDLQDYFETGIKEIYLQINKDKEWFSMSWIQDKANEYAKDFNAAKQAVIEQKFHTSFEDARALVLSRQWQELSLNVYPDTIEVETIEKKGKAEEIKAKQRIGREIERENEIVLLEENQRQLNKIIDLALRHSLKQLREQRGIVEDNRAENYFTKKAIQDYLILELQQYITEQRANRNEGQRIFNIFPSVRGLVSQEAGNLMRKKFNDFISKTDLDIFIERDEIAKIIEGNLKEHEHFETSSGHCQGLYKAILPGRLVDNYLKIANQTENMDFRQVLKALIENDPMSAFFITRLKLSLEPVLKDVRNTLAEGQIKTNFPHIYFSEWCDTKDEDIIKQFMNKDINSAKISREFLEEKKIIVLDEAKDKLMDYVNSLLLDGEKALNKQFNLVMKDTNYVIGLIDKVMKKNEITEEDSMWVYNECKKRVVEDWNDNRTYYIWDVKTPSRKYMQNKFKGLFKSTKEQIRHVITRYFNQKEIEKRKKALLAQEEIEDYKKGKKGNEGEKSGGPDGPGGGLFGVEATLGTPLGLLLLLLFLLLLSYLLYKLFLKRKERRVMAARILKIRERKVDMEIRWYPHEVALNEPTAEFEFRETVKTLVPKESEKEIN